MIIPTDQPEGAAAMLRTLGFAEAQRIVAAAIDDARRLDVRISVAVADEAGSLLAFARMDGATRLSALTSTDKTRTVILTGVPTRDLGENLRRDMTEEPQLFHGMIARDLVHFGGGVPVFISGHLAGAVAVSGATSLQDHEIAGRAAASVSP